MKEIEELITKADNAINRGNLDVLIEMYSDDAVLVVRPGMNAKGKDQIRNAFKNILDYFEHSLHVEQNGLAYLQSEDTVLVMAKTIISAKNRNREERKATYVFKQYESKGWLCIIDNSYGHELI